MGKNPLSTPDGHSLRNMRENSERARKNPGRDHNLFPSAGSTRATPLRSKKFLTRFALIVLFRAESGLAELRKRVFGPRSLVFGVRGPLRKWGAPYNFESGLRFILSTLVGRVGSSGVEGPGREKLLHWPSMVCWLFAPRPVLTQLMWSVVGSFLKFGRNSTCCQYGGGNVLPLPGSSLSQLFGVDHLSSRSPLHRLGEGQGRGGKRLPRAVLLPHCDRCLTGASALGFVHPHVEWKAESAF